MHIGAKAFLKLNLKFHSQASQLGLNRTGLMGFLNGQDRTTKFARQVLLDQTKSGLISLKILHTKHGDFGDYY